MATKSTFDPSGVFSGDFWKSLDDDTKEVVRGLLRQAGYGMQAQVEETRARTSMLNTQRDNVLLAQAGVRPGQYLSARQRREILNPESADEQKARLQFHGGIADGRWVTDYDTWLANRMPEDNKRLDGMKPLAFRVPTARQYSFGYTTEEQRRKRDAISRLHQYEEADKRRADLMGAIDLLNSGIFGAAKGGKSVRAATGGGSAGGFGYMSYGDQMREKLKNSQGTGFGFRSYSDQLKASEARHDREMALREKNAAREVARQTHQGAQVVGLTDDLGRSADPSMSLGRDGTLYPRDTSSVDPLKRVPGKTLRERITEDRQRREQSWYLSGDTSKAIAADKGGATMRERGWLDAVFNGGIVRAALKGGKGHK